MRSTWSCKVRPCREQEPLPPKPSWLWITIIKYLRQRCMEARKCVGNRERAQTYAIEFRGKSKKRRKKSCEKARKCAKKREKARKYTIIFVKFWRKKSCEKARKGAKMQFSFHLHANALLSNRLEFTGMKYNDELIVFCMIGSWLKNCSRQGPTLQDQVDLILQTSSL